MRQFFKWIYLCLILTLGSCSTALYDHYTYTETLETKVLVNTLVKQSVNPYTDFAPQVESVKGQFDKMLTYEKSKSKNPITIKMWEYVNNENNSIHKFFSLWKEQGTLSEAFTGEFKPKINSLFDSMLDYETKKDSESESKLLKIINAIP